jgi:hypothetical protein
MAAVLADAVNCYVRYAAAQRPSQRTLHRQAAVWLWSGDTEWPYSFENVCAALGLSMAALRQRVAQLGGASARGEAPLGTRRDGGVARRVIRNAA